LILELCLPLDQRTVNVMEQWMRKSEMVLLERKASELAALMRILASKHRLLILCQLVELGEASAGTLAESIGLSPSAMSQHLAKMRDEGLVTSRRESQTIWYRISDPRVEQLFATLHRLYCRDNGR